MSDDNNQSDRSGTDADVANAEAAVAEAEHAVQDAAAAVEQAQAKLEKATENRLRMEQRVEQARQALAMAEQLFEEARQECASRLLVVGNAMDVGKARLTAAQHALEAYLATAPAAASFHSWLHGHTVGGRPITPDVVRDRLNLSTDQQRLLHEYLCDKSPGYRNLVDKYRGEWAAAKGDVERQIVSRNARIHLSGEYAEQLARHALAPLGGKIETQGRTLVGDNGRYTKTDLIVSDLRVPVVLGRGEGMGAPVGGSMAFEVKCGKAAYLYAQKEHMAFQAQGHQRANAHCTLCSRDIHDLPSEQEKELREAMRYAGSPMVGMLPSKNEIDRVCLEAVCQEVKEQEQ